MGDLPPHLEFTLIDKKTGEEIASLEIPTAFFFITIAVVVAMFSLFGAATLAEWLHAMKALP